MEKMEGVTGAMTLVMTPVSIFAMLFVISGLVLLVGRFIMGGELTYGQVLACEGYISLILVLQAAVLTPTSSRQRIGPDHARPRALLRQRCFDRCRRTHACHGRHLRTLAGHTRRR